MFFSARHHLLPRYHPVGGVPLRPIYPSSPSCSSGRGMSQRSSNGPRFIYDLCPLHLVALNTTCITNPPNVSFPPAQCLPNHQSVPRVLDLWLHVTLPQTSSRPKNIYLPTYTYRTILLHHKQTTTSTFVDPLRIYIRCVRAPPAGACTTSLPHHMLPSISCRLPPSLLDPDQCMSCRT